MNTKAAVLAVIAMLAVVAVPLSLADEGDAVSDHGVVVTVRGGSDSISMSIDGGATKTTVLYVTNTSSDSLDITVPSVSSGHATIAGVVTVGGSFASMIEPKGGNNVAVVTVTVHTDRLSDNEPLSGSLKLNFTVIGSGETFTISVPYNITIESIYSSDNSYNKFFGIFPNTLPSPFNSVWFTCIATLILWILATIVMCEVIIPVIIRVVRLNKSKDAGKDITRKLTKTISLLMLVKALNECLNIMGLNAEIISFVANLSLVLYVTIGAFIAWQIYGFIISTLFRGLDETMEVDGVDSSLVPLFKLIGKLIICVVAATIILAAYGVDLAGLLVSAGVITLGITFGAQQIISQFFSGIVLLAVRPFKKDDFVNINGNTYKVHKVNLMYTEFENWDKDQIITMPNNVVSSATLVNYTKEDQLTRIFVFMEVAYDADQTKAKELLIQAANMHPHVIKDGSVAKPGTRLTAFNNAGIEYRLACFVDDFDNSRHYAGQLREIIYKLFCDNGIETTYERVEVEVVNVYNGGERPPMGARNSSDA